MAHLMLDTLASLVAFSIDEDCVRFCKNQDYVRRQNAANWAACGNDLGHCLIVICPHASLLISVENVRLPGSLRGNSQAISIQLPGHACTFVTRVQILLR
ncbi:hypothetical protein U1Q18_051447 [Sarracenia purpurea var. burkii]